MMLIIQRLFRPVRTEERHNKALFRPDCTEERYICVVAFVRFVGRAIKRCGSFASGSISFDLCRRKRKARVQACLRCFRKVRRMIGMMNNAASCRKGLVSENSGQQVLLLCPCGAFRDLSPFFEECGEYPGRQCRRWRKKYFGRQIACRKTGKM